MKILQLGDTQASEADILQVSHKFNFLGVYDKDWVTKDFLKMYLKNASSTARKNGAK